MSLSVLLSSLLSLVTVGSAQIKGSFFVAQESSCYFLVGSSVTGREVTVDLCSVTSAGGLNADFIYYLGDERVDSQANCAHGTWTTFPERQVHRPQSEATQKMLSAVCLRNRVGDMAVVYDPPSNVRVSPNGSILCTLAVRGNLSVYGSTGDWYYTYACGSLGVIHDSQIRF